MGYNLSFCKHLKIETTPKDPQESKWIDSILNIIQDRIAVKENDINE
jgi:hypothetical protein